MHVESSEPSDQSTRKSPFTTQLEWLTFGQGEVPPALLCMCSCFICFYTQIYSLARPISFVILLLNQVQTGAIT